MKHLVRWTMPFAAALILSACGNNNENNTATSTKEDHGAMGHNDQGSHPAGAIRMKEVDLDPVYQHYIHLTTALANSDSAEAKAAANAIEAGARVIPNGGGLASAAARVTAASNIEGQRAAYDELSKQMIQRVKTSGVTSGELYVQHCPMAFNDKGASWISSSKEIRNPYFGQKMLTCGETKETIK